uniref:Uncharacterized protein n=1 Tax=Syphacia muris TaxID=451379 RepID=A0A0N5ANJ4_9BILA
MCTENEVREEMVPWSWDYLFACISMELREAYGSEDSHDDDK